MYVYTDFLNDVEKLKTLGADVLSIGKSVAGREIKCVHVGDYSKNQIIVQGAIHAREYVTAKLVVNQAYHTLESRDTLNGGIYFIPMANPDGAELCQLGLSSVPEYKRNFLFDVNGENLDFTLWKANINAVDLNTNFDARWGTGIKNVRQPAPENYVGPYVCSEPETQALIRFTEKINPTLTLSYHCKGREIYWEFYQEGAAAERDKKVGTQISQITGYTLVDGALGSAGGYKDWCVKRKKIPAYTIEIIPDFEKYPVSEGALETAFTENKDVPQECLLFVSLYVKGSLSKICVN